MSDAGAAVPESEPRAGGPEHPEEARVGLADLSPAVRIAAGAAALTLAAASVAINGLDGDGLIGAALCAVLVVLAAFDLECSVIPNRVVLPAIAVILAVQLIVFPGDALEWLAATVGAGAVLFLPRLFRSEAVGIGDVKLAMLLGAGLGGTVTTALLVGSLAAVPVAIWILATRGAAARNDVIPFGPFLALGGILAVLL